MLDDGADMNLGSTRQCVRPFSRPLWRANHPAQGPGDFAEKLLSRFGISVLFVLVWRSQAVENT